MRRFASLAVLSVLLVASVAGALESPVGKWKTVDEKTGKVVSQVEIYDQGGKLFGKITGLSEPNKENGEPKTCSKCTGADKDKPIVGLVIIRDLSPGDSSYKGGTIIDPDDGKVYKAEVWVEDGKLKVRGYLGLFYRTQTWLKNS
jgi:uncharacterized protein (DUF2147 family)